MIYAIADELAAALRAQEVPFRVVIGPEPTMSGGASAERIVIWEPPDEKRDSVGAPKAVHRNPTMPFVLVQAARMRVYAQSTIAGARVQDHYRRARLAVSHAVAELDEIVRKRKNTLTFGASGFVTLLDAKGSGVFAGAVYELDFFVDRACLRINWKGEAADEKVIGVDVTVESTTKVSNAPGRAGTPPDGAEIASGG